jgi:hypothetical protein
MWRLKATTSHLLSSVHVLLLQFTLSNTITDVENKFSFLIRCLLGYRFGDAIPRFHVFSIYRPVFLINTTTCFRLVSLFAKHETEFSLHYCRRRYALYLFQQP